MISHKLKLIFVHIPKCAGGSLTQAIRRIDSDAHEVGTKDFCRQHLSIQELSDNGFVQPEWLQQYLIVAPIRNSWSRAVSSYHSHAKHRASAEAFKQDLMTKGEEWPRNGGNPHERLAHRRQQIDFLTVDGAFQADFIIRFEHLLEDWNNLCRLLKIPTSKLPHIHKDAARHGLPYTAYYDAESRQIVAEKFKDDIMTWGFEFGK